MITLMVIIAAAQITTACSSVKQTQEKNASPYKQVDLRELLMPPLPEWAKDGLDEGYYFNMDRLMKAEKLSRHDAIETQNWMREYLAADQNISIAEAYEKALLEVRAGHRQSGWKQVEFKHHGDFVLVTDMDETILKQWYGSGSSGFYDLKDVTPDQAVAGSGELVTSSTYIKLTPGFERFIRRMKANPRCKGIAVFSGKRNIPTFEIMNRLRFSNGKAVMNHIDGVFGRSHMVIGRRVALPSKDMRIFDPELKHVVLVDDNPLKIFQPQILRAQPKFDADRYRTALNSKDKQAVSYYETLLDNAADEIEESSRAADKLGIPFSQAFLPYSYSGERVFRTLAKTLHSSKKALEITRLKPYLQDATFRPERDIHRDENFPSHWWLKITKESVAPSEIPKWEILPHEAGPGEVILSKRNELGIISNFAPTPFEFRGKRYASLEGFWQMMKYPEENLGDESDPRKITTNLGTDLQWAYTREQVAGLVSFDAKKAGDLASENMKKLGIDWVSFEGRRITYKPKTPGEHYDLILAAMRAKLEQNPEVRKILLSTGNLVLKPDHRQEPDAHAAWRYHEIWMKIRKELHK